MILRASLEEARRVTGRNKFPAPTVEGVGIYPVGSGGSATEAKNSPSLMAGRAPPLPFLALLRHAGGPRLYLLTGLDRK
jgi:hypothetical protein